MVTATVKESNLTCEILYSPGILCWTATIHHGGALPTRLRIHDLEDLLDIVSIHEDMQIIVVDGDGGESGLESLPTFGGPDPLRDDAWSWDKTRVLVHGPRGWRIVKR